MTTTAAPLPIDTKPTRAKIQLSRLTHSPGGVFGALWLIVLTIASTTSDWWLPYETEAQDFSAVLSGPTTTHWLGTDELGRDLLSRIVAAAAGALGTNMITVGVAVGLGLTLALCVANAGPRTETVVNRAVDVLMSLPITVILLAAIGLIGTNISLIMAILGFLIATGIYRTLVGQTKSLYSQLYVDAARVDGVSGVSISLRHVLPGLGNTLAVQAALIFAIGLLIQSGLAFIGFGPPLPNPSWGGMIASASQHIYDAPWLMVPTGAVLSITVLAANALGAALAGPSAPRSRSPRGGGRPQRQKSAAVREETDAQPSNFNRARGLQLAGVRIGVKDGPELVSDVSLSLDEGKVLGLVGESGCGKTMTAVSLLGLLPAGISVTKGSIHWNGALISGMTERELEAVRGHDIALISQEPMRALDPMFTIGYQLIGTVRRLQRLNKRAARKEASFLLERVGIVDPERILKSYPHQLSGGMAQRVAIAVALSGKPRLLIADEPTTALDVTVQAEILSLLRSLVKRTGMSMVIVTHDLGVVADICDDVAVMYAGQVVENGTTLRVLDQPRHPYTLALLAADPHAVHEGEERTRLATIEGQVPQPKDWPSGCRFIDRCQFAGAACAVAVPLLPSGGGHTLVRCVKADQLAVEGLDWVAAEAPLELAQAEKDAK